MMCCASLRGASFCGASIHITLGAVLFIRYVIVTAFLTFFNVTDVIKDRITGYLLPFVAYITLFLAFGIVIFHSVEKEYFIILKWATLGFAILQILVLIILYFVRFYPAFEYRQFPFLPVSITDGYVQTGFHHQLQQDAEGCGKTRSTPCAALPPLPPESEEAGFLPKFTQYPDGTSSLYPTSSTSGGGGGRHYYGGHSSSEISGESGGNEEVEVLPPPPPTPPPVNKKLGRLYTLIALIIMTLVSLVYLSLLLIYVRQLIYEDSGHVFGHAQSVTRNVAFYVQPQFAQSGNSDNKLTNSPSPALRSQALHQNTFQQQQLQQQQQGNLPNCTTFNPASSNTQIPSNFQSQNLSQQQQPRPIIGNHLKQGVGGNQLDSIQKDPHTSQQHTPTSSQQNHLSQRSPVPPAREMQQNINQQQQQVITIYPQKGGGFTSSSSSPRMQVKFAKPLEQTPSPGVLAHSHNPHHPLNYAGELPPEPTRSCLANPLGNAQHQQQQQHQQQPTHMMPPPPPPRLGSRNHPPPPHMMHPQHQHQPSPLPPHHHPPHLQHGQHGFHPQQQQQPQPCPAPPPSYAHQHHHPHQPQQQQLPYHPQQLHGKSRTLPPQQQCYSNDMVDNSSYLVFSGNPNTSNTAPPPPLPPHMASSSAAALTHNTYPHYSQRRPSGSMV